MLLSEKLSAISEQAASRIPSEVQAIMNRATEDLRSSGILDKVIKTGQTMPGFTLLNQSGIPVSSSALLASGPLVLTVFRGSW